MERSGAGLYIVSLGEEEVVGDKIGGGSFYRSDANGASL